MKKIYIALSLCILSLVAIFLISSAVTDNQKQKTENESIEVVQQSNAEIFYFPRTEENKWKDIDTPFWASRYMRDVENRKIYFQIEKRDYERFVEVEGVDFDSFQVLSVGGGKMDKNSYGRDNESVYCDAQKMSGVDNKTFREFERFSNYMVDKKGVYIDCEFKPEIDLKTFQIISAQSSEYSFDKDTVYYRGTPLEMSDPSGNMYYGYLKDNSELFINNNHIYQKEKHIGDSEYQGEIREPFSLVISDYFRKFSRGEGNGPENVSFVFSFDEKNNKIVSYVSDIFVSSISGVMVKDSKLYYFDTESVLNILDLKTLNTYEITSEVLKLVDYNDLYQSYATRINSYYPVGNDEIYMLHGDNCNSYRAACDLQLYLYNIKDQTFRDLGITTDKRTIVGVDGGNILLEKTFGDAGYHSIDAELIDLATKESSEFYKSGAYQEETGGVVWEGDVVVVDELYKRYDTGEYARGLMVEDGEVTTLQTVSDNFAEIHFLDK